MLKDKPADKPKVLGIGSDVKVIKKEQQPSKIFLDKVIVTGKVVAMTSSFVKVAEKATDHIDTLEWFAINSKMVRVVLR